MKIYLLPEKGEQYKANLHCHSTVSDGANTPEEMKNCYKKHGYSILAITDHELLVNHSDLDDEEFLTISGYEYAFMECGDIGYKDVQAYKRSKTVELNLYPKDKYNETHICFNPKYVMHGEKFRCETLKRIGEPFEREFTIECIQKVIDTAKENGFLVSLNHPAYSMVTPEFFGRLKGLMSLEIINQGSYYSNGDNNISMYDEILRQGNEIFAIATDDNHRASVYDDNRDKRPWGATMIKSKSLTYKDVISAMEQGNMYATQGPIIFDLYVEGDKVHMTFEKAKVACMITPYRNSKYFSAPKGEYLEEAVFDFPKDDLYMRFEVIDEFGRRAQTRGYFIKKIR